MVQVNLFQKRLFLHQLTYNMTEDCSLNYQWVHENYRQWTCCVHKLGFLGVVLTFRTIYVHNMFWACNFHVLNWQFNEQSFVILWFSWCKKKCLWKRFTCSWWQNMLFWQRTTCTVERNLEYVYDIDQLYNQSRLDPDETILQVVLKGSFLTSELTNLARHYLEISAVLKDDKGTIMLSLNQRFFRWINWNERYQNENF